MNTNGCGKSGRAQRHTLKQRQSFRQGHNPVTENADILPKTATGNLAEVVAGNYYALSLAKPVIAALLNNARRIDTGNMRIVLRNALITGGGQCIFIIQRGVVHADQHFVVGKPVERPLANGSLKRATRIVFYN